MEVGHFVDVSVVKTNRNVRGVRAGPWGENPQNTRFEISNVEVLRLSEQGQPLWCHAAFKIKKTLAPHHNIQNLRWYLVWCHEKKKENNPDIAQPKWSLWENGTESWRMEEEEEEEEEEEVLHCFHIPVNLENVSSYIYWQSAHIIICENTPWCSFFFCCSTLADDVVCCHFL